ncbi:uncharacterized protein LOC131029121 [Cryptomeria japonica]|uniref:uncharacterized protein LOC131029121 n=1 Tax=Cryptomeria japonica TaxID=3369 RepID=UPI0027DA62F0|nr:uncharacterized protein LOC131029121 [Cryptomeria japonica]
MQAKPLTNQTKSAFLFHQYPFILFHIFQVICSLHTTEHEALKLSRHCNLKQVDRIGFMMLLINNAGQSVMSHYTSYSFQQLSNYLLL